MKQLQEHPISKTHTFPLKLNIQHFAEPEVEPDVKAEPDVKTEPDNKTEPDKKPEQITFTPEQQQKVNEIVQGRLADAEKQRVEAVKEAEKLAKMNAQQRQEHELATANEKIATLEREQNLHKMSLEASKMFAEKNITATPDLLAQVTKETAEDTQKAVEEFTKLVDSEVQKQIADKLRGETPVAGNNPTASGYQSLDDIAKLPDASDRLALIRKYHV